MSPEKCVKSMNSDTFVHKFHLDAGHKSMVLSETSTAACVKFYSPVHMVLFVSLHFFVAKHWNGSIFMTFSNQHAIFRKMRVAIAFFKLHHVCSFVEMHWTTVKPKKKQINSLKFKGTWNTLFPLSPRKKDKISFDNPLKWFDLHGIFVQQNIYIYFWHWMEQFFSLFTIAVTFSKLSNLSRSPIFMAVNGVEHWTNKHMDVDTI